MTGNIAPERKNSGMISICVNAMNDWICLMRAATITPNAVSMYASRVCMANTSRISDGA